MIHAVRQTRMHAAMITMTVIAAADPLIACGSDDDSGESSTTTLSSSCVGPADEAPEDLACTGLYADFGSKTLAPTTRSFAPAVSFWSDGFEKDRFIALPEGASIDAANVDEWTFPVGTKAWKEIRQGQRKIETRFFWKVKEDRWEKAAYVWSEDGTRAVRGEGTDIVVNGSPYHVPKGDDCTDCHHGRKDKLLGFEAISLAQPGASGLTLRVLADEHRIVPAPAKTSITLPHAAFGVLHVNCGVTCHNGSSTASGYSTGLRLRLGFEEVSTKTQELWEATTTTVGVEPKLPGWDEDTRVKPGAPDQSLIVTVMKTRGKGQMPPLATTVIDAKGVAAVEDWIRTLGPNVTRRVLQE